MKAEKHSFSQITLCRLEFRHNRSSKIICFSHLNGMANTVKRSSRMVLWREVGWNLFRCQNILVAPSLRNPEKLIQVPTILYIYVFVYLHIYVFIYKYITSYIVLNIYLFIYIFIVCIIYKIIFHRLENINNKIGS